MDPDVVGSIICKLVWLVLLEHYIYFITILHFFLIITCPFLVFAIISWLLKKPWGNGNSLKPCWVIFGSQPEVKVAIPVTFSKKITNMWISNSTTLRSHFCNYLQNVRIFAYTFYSLVSKHCRNRDISACSFLLTMCLVIRSHAPPAVCSYWLMVIYPLFSQDYSLLNGTVYSAVVSMLRRKLYIILELSFQHHAILSHPSCFFSSLDPGTRAYVSLPVQVSKALMIYGMCMIYLHSGCAGIYRTGWVCLL